MTTFTHSVISDHQFGQEHVSHLLYPLGWEHGWEPLIEAMDQVWELASSLTESIALGGKGAYDLLLHPRRPVFTLIPNVDQGRRVADLTEVGAEALIDLVGNNGCGPKTGAELVEEFGHTLGIAQNLGRPVLIGGHCGLYDPLVKPDGSWLLLPQALPSRELVAWDQAKADGRINAILDSSGR